MGSETEKPNWWHENEVLREQMNLPPYRPPRFLDDRYTHEIINSLEQKHDLEIRLVGRNTRYGDDWEIIVDNERIDSLGRHRDKDSNTVYEIKSNEFQEIVEDSLQ